MRYFDKRPEGEELLPHPGLPTFQERRVHDAFLKSQFSNVGVYAHGRRPMTDDGEHVTLEIISGGSRFSLRLSPDDAAWLGHTLLSAQDDALRMAGPDYADSPAGDERHIIDDHKAQQRREDQATFDQYRDSVSDPRD